MRTSNVSSLALGVVLADVAGEALQGDQMLMASAQFVISGTGASAPAGSLKFQYSNTPPQVYYEKTSTQTTLVWTDIGSPVAVAAAGTFGIPKTEMCYQWVRLDYHNTAAIVAASLVNQSLTYTSVPLGTIGNATTIRLLDPSAINQALSVTVSGVAITVHLATDGAGMITSTGDDIKAAVNASVLSSPLILVSGTNASVVTALVATHLASGTDGGTIVSSQVKTMGY